MTIHEMRSESSPISIERACELLNLPRIEYYRWISRAEYLSKITQEDKIILEKIKEIIEEYPMFIR